MRGTFASFVYGWLVFGVVFGAESAMLAAPEQVRPGEPTPARVWIQNQGKDEAVPVSLRDAALEVPLRVQVAGIPTITVAGTPTITLGPSSAVLQTRAVRQAWEYRTVNVTSVHDAAAILSTAGQDGWETTGHQFPLQDGAVVLLKRLR